MASARNGYLGEILGNNSRSAFVEKSISSSRNGSSSSKEFLEIPSKASMLSTLEVESVFSNVSQLSIQCFSSSNEFRYINRSYANTECLPQLVAARRGDQWHIYAPGGAQRVDFTRVKTCPWLSKMFDCKVLLKAIYKM
ncbi:hypothetical protein KIN20_024261 [Parelaphostrongylus tenuis]|uniref:Uncharacterized protein n=1 Tax=Parelaphostrongylus tenuis TaxID=148309 RepID=A0AAD5QXK8_PARTN|nr:hypothetical protein KIN20_024261 [Parelaphostrongylus tenuis]